jgi:hypothetical protein
MTERPVIDKGIQHDRGMKPGEKLAVVEEILERAAENIGDITDPAMAAFYARSPGGRELFAHHARHLGHLEGLMVEQSVYCLMQWFRSPSEIEILLRDTVPHHKETLKIPTYAYKDLLIATADIIGGSIPMENDTEKAIWVELCGQLLDAVDNSD